MNNVLLIGNGPCIFDTEFGEKINNFNGLLVRFNHFRIENYEKYIGKRPADIWFVGELDHSNSINYYDYVIIYCTNFNSDMIECIYRNNRNNKILILPYNIIINAAKQIENRPGAFPTSGGMAIYYFIFLGYTVYVHGFDFCERGTDYFDGANYLSGEKKMPMPCPCHDWDLEKKYVNRLIEEKKIFRLL